MFRTGKPLDVLDFEACIIFKTFGLTFIINMRNTFGNYNITFYSIYIFPLNKQYPIIFQFFIEISNVFLSKDLLLDKIIYAFI